MTNKQEITKAFREARIAGEKLLNEGKISWFDYCETMGLYESALRECGEDF